MSELEQAVTETNREPGEQGSRPPRARRKQAKTVSQVTWSEATAKLDETERAFVRECMKDGDTQRAARVVRHRTPFELLGRVTVREAILSAAPFTDSYLTARLTRPFVLQQLVNLAMSGDVQAVKVLLSLDVKPPTPAVNYTRSPTRTESEASGLDAESVTP